MKIRIPLSAMFRGITLPFTFDSPEFKKTYIGKPVYLDRYRVVGHITEVCPEADSFYAEVEDAVVSDMIVDSKGLNKCGFEIVFEYGENV